MTNDLSQMSAVMRLRDGEDKRDLEWCVALADYSPSFPERRAINIAVGIALRLLLERETMEVQIP